MMLPLHVIEYLVDEFVYVVYKNDEPVPSFRTRYPNILESCLAAPFQSFGGAFLYKTLAERASILFYLLIKNHPFQNGNKRLAVIITLYYLAVEENYWLETDAARLYEVAVRVASSKPEEKDKVLAELATFFTTSVRRQGVS